MLAQGYARTYQTNAVLTASPGKLVLMLYDGALKALSLARTALERPESDFRRIEVVNQQLQKAQLIISELQSGLNFEAGGEVATRLNGLYEFYNRRLFAANMRKEIGPVIEVEKMLNELRDAWAEMLTKQGGDPRNTESIRGVA